MQVKIDRETLLKGVGRTLGVVDRRGTMPILGNFLLQTDENRVIISATDLEVSFRGFYPAEVLEHGAVTVQAHYFFNLIKELPGDTLDLTGTEKSSLKIQVGDSRYQLNGLPADNFPPVPEITDQNLVEVESRMVKEMIEKTIFSVSVDDLQYHLSSIFWERVEADNGFLLRLISTDGHRLTLIERPLPGSEQFSIEKGILIPRKGMAEVIRFLAEEEKVSLGLGTQSLALKADDRYLFIRLLLDKKFPEYRRIIPETFGYRFAINRRELHRDHQAHLAALQRALQRGGPEAAGGPGGSHLHQPGSGRRPGSGARLPGDRRPRRPAHRGGLQRPLFPGALERHGERHGHPGSQRQGPPLPPGGPGRPALLQHHHAHEPVMRVPGL